MTENQEKELFNKLNTLVTGVRTIQTDVQEIKETLKEHSVVLIRLEAKQIILLRQLLITKYASQKRNMRLKIYAVVCIKYSVN